MESRVLSIKMTYRFDGYLMFLIQDVTKKDSVDILAFFSDIVKAVCTIGVEKRAGNRGGIRKTINDFFPGTSIPFCILVKGHQNSSRSFNPHTRAYNDDGHDVFRCDVEVGFPERCMSFSEEKIAQITEALVERELLGGECTSLQPFDKPNPKTPKMYKKIMESVWQGQQENQDSRL